jgi:hypothetical protein
MSLSLTTTLPLTQTKSHKKSKQKSKQKDKEKKRKEPPTQEDASLERVKKKSKSAKGKERASSSSVGEFVRATSSLDLSLPPYYTNSPLSGAISVLDGLVMRYVPSGYPCRAVHLIGRVVDMFRALMESYCRIRTPDSARKRL